jgi:oxygen-dependent protoporphyrinogen oxidase
MSEPGRHAHGVDRCGVAVVGGGITGLAAAHRLVEMAAERGAEPDFRLVESSERLGGAIRTERLSGHVLESGPDTLLARKPAAVALCERLGLGEALVGFDERAHEPLVFRRGRLVPVPAGFMLMAPTRLWPVLASPLFSLPGKLRLACEPFIRPAPDSGDDESLSSFVTRRFGREVLERVAQPIMSSLFMANADRMSVRMAMPRLMEMEHRHGSITRAMRAARRARLQAAGTGATRGRGEYVALREGMGSLVDAVLARLPQRNLLTRTRITSVRRDDPSGTWHLSLEGRRPIEAEAVVFACPAWATARLLEETDAELAGDLAGIEYASCATVSVSYRSGDLGRTPDRFGFFVPRSEGLPMLACTFVSEKFGGRAPEGRFLLRAFVGGAEQPDVLDLDDRGLVGLVHAVLGKLLAIRRPPVLGKVFRHSRAMPQLSVGLLGRLERMRARLARHVGLLVAGGGQGIVGIADSVATGERAAAEALDVAVGREARSARPAEESA